ncbi:MAG TPA: YbaN family protein [Candidatus Nanopelagicales bacterium]|nr:YbaN family protein [Candidatus Nanopelagicales bacterium]
MRAFFVVLGTVFLGLGALGLVLPVLPTTPFVLLAAACYLRASTRLHQWLVHSRTFGPTIVAWQEHGAIPPRAKAIAIAMVILTFGFSIVFAVEPPLMRAGLAGLGIVLVVWLAHRPSWSPPEGATAPRRIVE